LPIGRQQARRDRHGRTWQLTLRLQFAMFSDGRTWAEPFAATRSV